METSSPPLNTFKVRHEALLAKLRRHAPSLYTDRIAPSTFAVSEAQQKQLAALQAALGRAIPLLVNEILSGKLYAHTLTVPEKILKVVLGSDRPYRAGAIRPDFLISAEHEFKICEINARFPVNGYLISQLLSEEAHDFCQAGESPLNSLIY